MNTPLIPVSWGELIDKITILEIKADHISSSEALANVNNELKILWSECQQIVLEMSDLKLLKQELSEVNKALWKIEDDIRDKERYQAFDEVFIQLARCVYRKNDERARIKRRINEIMRSDLMEEKSYKPY